MANDLQGRQCSLSGASSSSADLRSTYSAHPPSSSSLCSPSSHAAFPVANSSPQALSFAHGSSRGHPGNGLSCTTSGYGSSSGYQTYTQGHVAVVGSPWGTNYNYQPHNPSPPSITYVHNAVRPYTQEYCPAPIAAAYPIHQYGAQQEQNLVDGPSYGNLMVSHEATGSMSTTMRIGSGGQRLPPGELWQGGIYCKRCEVFDHMTSECKGEPVCFKCCTTGHKEVACPAKVTQSYCDGCRHHDVYHKPEHCLGEEKEDKYMLLRVLYEAERSESNRLGSSNALYGLPATPSSTVRDGSASPGHSNLPPLPLPLAGIPRYDLSTVDLNAASLEFDRYLSLKEVYPNYIIVQVPHSVQQLGSDQQSLFPQLQQPQQLHGGPVPAAPGTQNEAELLPAALPTAMVPPSNLTVASATLLNTALSSIIDNPSFIPEAREHTPNEALPTVEEEEEPLDEKLADGNPENADSTTSPERSSTRKRIICARKKKYHTKIATDEMTFVFPPSYVPTSKLIDGRYREPLSEEEIERLREHRHETRKGSLLKYIIFEDCTIADCGCVPPPVRDQPLPQHECDNCGPCAHTTAQCDGQMICFKCNLIGHKVVKCPAEALHFLGGCPGCDHELVYHSSDNCPGVDAQNRVAKMLAKHEKGNRKSPSTG